MRPLWRLPCTYAIAAFRAGLFLGYHPVCLFGWTAHCVHAVGGCCWTWVGKTGCSTICTVPCLTPYLASRNRKVSHSIGVALCHFHHGGSAPEEDVWCMSAQFTLCLLTALRTDGHRFTSGCGKCVHVMQLIVSVCMGFPGDQGVMVLGWRMRTPVDLLNFMYLPPYDIPSADRLLVVLFVERLPGQTENTWTSRLDQSIRRNLCGSAHMTRP